MGRRIVPTQFNRQRTTMTNQVTLAGHTFDADDISGTLPHEHMIAVHNAISTRQRRQFASAEDGAKAIKNILDRQAAAKQAADEAKSKRRSPISDAAVITVIASENPKRAGSAAHGRFAQYRTGMTVAEATKAGLLHEDLRYDRDHGHISIKDPA